MPFTPFHFGPHACVALPLQRYIDVPVFVAANIVVDIEPATVMVFRPDYPLHGYCHTLLVGGVIGLLWGAVAWPLRGRIAKMMAALRLAYSPGLLKMLLSGLLGVWLHVLFDAVLYPEMKPFWPLAMNPFLGLLDAGSMYLICTLCFIPALMMYNTMVAGKGATRPGK
jgi:hypothetical protein